MKLCDDGHDEIVIDERTHNCPLCVALEELEEKNEQTAELEERIDTLEDDVERLSKEIETPK